MNETDVLSHEKEGYSPERLQYPSTIFLSVYSSLLYCVGVPGNLITIAVLRGRSLREKFLSTLLTYESVFNLTDLIGGLGRLWLIGVTGFDYRLVSRTACVGQHWLFFTNHMMVNWTLVYVTAARLIYMALPSKW
ncbi:uncharacterized protein LOC101852824, partial [Aplysia californica]|uniref:Uncharacterized protein LOC101852824 n=1 Tax=Aplysia californica TaxID=6500 RepID=A0ABM0KB71_APLCA